MFKNYFITAYRNLIKRKFYSAINIFGLSLGIACSLLLYLFISYHVSFDRYHKNASTTYRVVNELFYGKTIHEKGASIAMYQALASGVTHVSKAAVFLNNYTFTVTLKDLPGSEKRFKEDKNITFISPGWFTMFDYKWIAGNAADLNSPNTVVISQRQAAKYFGTVNPIGRTLVFDNRQTFKIVGLLADKPFNTDLRSDIFVSLPSLRNLFPATYSDFTGSWGWMNSTTSLYVTLDGKTSKSVVESAIAGLAKANLGDNAKYYHFWLQPLGDVHFNADYGGSVQKSLLLTLTVIGILVLLIGSFNYINISIAQQSKRMVEIGTRKVLGGTRLQLFAQFIMETSIVAAIAIITGIVAVSLLLPVANQFLFLPDPVRLLSYKGVLIFAAILFFVLVMLSGFYPAFVLSRINVFKAMKAEAGTWKAGRVRKTLVIVQNAVSYILIICAFIMVLQVHYLKSTDIGFNRESVVLLPLPDSSQLKKDLLQQEFEKIPQITSFTFCFKPPSSESNFGGSVKFDDRPDWEPWPAGSPVGDTSYVKSFGLQIIAGRNIRESYISTEYLINETMVRKLGLKRATDALSKSLVAGQFNDRKGIIVGVVKDFNAKSLQVPIEPEVIANIPEKFTTIGVKLNAGNPRQTLEKIREKWEAVYPQAVFEYNFFDEQIAGLYKQEDLQQKIVSLAGLIAVIISCLGLLGLASLVILQRTKEIGIRKVIGASARSIAFLLSRDFLQLILLSLVIAFPIAWWAINKWLEGFAYRIDIKWWMFVLGGVLSVLIALVTVNLQAINAAVANPVKSLRTE